MSNLTFVSSSFEHIYDEDNVEKYYNRIFCEEYMFHSIVAWNQISVYKNGELIDTLEAQYQTGQSFLNGDYSCPNPNLELYNECSADLLCIIDCLDKDDCENARKRKLENILSEIKDRRICDYIETHEDILSLYEASIKDCPDAEYFLPANHSFNVEDYKDHKYEKYEEEYEDE